jgi:hypothetical protein
MRIFSIDPLVRRTGSGSSRAASAQRGFALVLVLCFVVLISVIVLAYLSHSLLNRQIANTSASGTRADIFAQGAIDSILGDLKQEIVAGSTASTTTPPYYTPIAAANAVPALSGNSDPTDLPNLLKISNAGTPFYPNDPITRASNDFTTNSSINGRSVTLARWNDPLLLPKATPSSTTNYAPDSAKFVAPTWILVARDGTNPTTFSSTMAPTVVGRYAFAIYNEGGLLDLNVAGYPSNAATVTYTPPASLSLVTHKAGLAHADLSQIPDTTTATPDTPGMTPTEIDQLIGWRNYATTGPSGTFPNFSFGTSSAPATAYFNAILATPNFLTTSNTALATTGGNTGSDQKFTSRQQLINFFNNGLGAATNARLQDTLQFFGTFSRGLNQPSFTPDPARPMTPAAGSDSTNAGNSLDGQDAVGNPAFLSVTVQNSFKRNDSSQAVVGEPLVKKRFALNRLAWLTYEGPSATRNITSPSSTSGNADYDIYQLENQYGITQTFLSQGTAANIQAYFGLQWVQDSFGHTGYWKYIDNPANAGINKLSDVVALATPREADFFELLKAGVPLGSLGKAATNPTGMEAEAADYQYDHDADYAVMQIGANILAQSTADGYPPRIQFTDNGGTQTFAGVKNLPYFYRVRVGTVISKMPNPEPPAGDAPAGQQAQPTGTPNYYSSTNSASGFNWFPDFGTVTETGSYAILFEPEIWNPHDANSSLGSPRPQSLRIIADGASDPKQVITISQNILRNSFQTYPGGQSIPPVAAHANTLPTGQIAEAFDSYGFSGSDTYVTNWNADSTAMTFTDNGGALFREPTLLAEPGLPSGSNLLLGPANEITKLYGSTGQLSNYGVNLGAGLGVACLNDLSHATTNSGTAYPYIGFFYGSGPLRWNGHWGGTDYIFTATMFESETGEEVTKASTYSVQYSNDGLNWITYDQKYVPDPGFLGFPKLLYSGQVDYDNRAIGSDGFALTSADPRTRRFGNPGNSPQGVIFTATDSLSGLYGESTQPMLQAQRAQPPGISTGSSSTFSFWTDRDNNVMMSDRPTASSGLGWFNLDAARPAVCLPIVGGWFPSSGSSYSWNTTDPTASPYYQPGLLSQNNPLVISDGPIWESGTPGSPLYFADPDGVVRRAMGGYNAPASASAAPSDGTTYGLPMAAATSGPSGSGFTPPTNQSQSRPVILNRPFRSVAELGYVFSGTPWRNLDMFTPESAAAPLLDVFCIQADDNPSPLTAGTVDLNTRQVPVLQAVLAGAYYDEVDNTVNDLITQTEAQQIAQALVKRTSDLTTAGKGPLTNIADLVGRYYTTINAAHGGIDGSQSYVGLTSDLSQIYSTATPKYDIERLREAAIRPLAAVGNTRVWNLMIDLIAQTGKYPSTAAKLSDFYVEGETRYWLHVAIDRQTGQVLDQSLEVVK